MNVLSSQLGRFGDHARADLERFQLARFLLACQSLPDCGRLSPAGVTASALVCYHNDNGFNNVSVHTKGGDLTVEYDRIDDDRYSNIWLCGPAKKVFEGELEIA